MAILSLDCGTTGVTALLVGADARVLARGYREFPQHFPYDGWVEHGPGEIWAATLEATREALAASPEAPTAVGITNQRETVCFWDRETLGASRRAIVWQDRRTAAMCEDLRAAGHEARVTELTGLRLDPYFSGTKIAWVRDHDPTTWAQVTSGRVAIGTVDSYLIARMTRGLHHVTDPTNASRTLLFDIRTGEWSAELCDLLGVPLDALPEIVPSYGEIARTDPATFLGLDIPIAGIAGDQQAALVGQAGFAPGSAKCTYGTGSFLLVNTGDRAVATSSGLLTTVALGRPDGSLTYALEGAVFVTGSAVQWLRDGLEIIESASQTQAIAESVPDSGGVVFVPALTGLGAPDWDPYARGMIIGITRGTTRAHIVRATLDAIAFQVRDVVDLMAREGGVNLNSLAVDGGAAANDLLCQIQADQVHIPVDRSAELQTTGLGAAFLAGLGTGVWSAESDLVSTRRSDQVFTPQADGEAAHRRWRRAVDRAKGWLEED
ncbi:MAG: FGGY family carbohydrate kinase [Candidatus Nanopelagicales bacterium]